MDCMTITPGVKTPSILIVEDESIIAFNLQEVLESLDYSVPAIADSGERAIRQAAELRPNLVLMDIRIKGDIDGIQAAEQIWQRFQIPVIYVTGHSDQATVERARLTAPFGYLLKPIKERELYVAIESALQRSERERWMSKVLNGIGDAVIVIDASGVIKFLNPIAETLTGWQLQDAIGRSHTTVFNLISEPTRLPVHLPIEAALQQNITAHLTGDVLLISKQGAEVPIADSVAPFTDNEGAIAGAVIVFRDVTAQRQAEEHDRTLHQANLWRQRMEELEQINHLKDDFLSTVSHELRTPLTNIKMAIKMLELVLDQQGILSPENNPRWKTLTQYMEILRNQCDQELHLVNDLLDLQRLNANSYPVEQETIPLADWLPELVNSFRTRAQERNLQLSVQLAPDLPPLVSDLPSLNRIFIELLNNACKYTPPGERITLTAHLGQPATPPLEPTPATPCPYFIFTVTNTGVNISAEEQIHIFEPFYRIPRSDRWQQGGTGLGLALVKKLVDCLHGCIRVENHPGQACFIVELPAPL